MKGKYEIIVKNRRLQYKFTVNKNITILRGDSATGKTTMIEMIEAYQNNGEASGIILNCPKNCVVLTENRWQDNLKYIKDSIVFIDEGNRFVESTDFAKAIQNSDNYYVIATRNGLNNLPYSIQEIYGIKNKAGNRYQGTKRIYSEFYPLVDAALPTINKPDLVIVEDAKSGFQFFSDFFKEYDIPCISSNGKSNIYSTIINRDEETILVIADGAAFGPEVEKVKALSRCRNLMLYMPESFEWLVLKSDLLKDKYVTDVLNNPCNYIDSEEYFSWERFFTAVLIERSEGTYLKYTKQNINPAYLNSKEKIAIKKVLPELDF